MNKTDLVIAVAEEVGLTKKDAEKGIDIFLDSIQRALLKGETVKLSGFGTFIPKTNKERIGTSPVDGSRIVIPETNTIKFKVSKNFKELIK